MSFGSLMIDIAGFTLTPEDRELLQHPLVGGVILFTRNYDSIAQLQGLTNEIHALRQPALLIAVDHEGGRVQRFRHGFTRLPAAAQVGQLYDHQHRQGLQAAEKIGFLLAAELRAVGVDFSFAPVLDVARGVSSVIGDRAFHVNGEVIGQLAGAMMLGMKQGGMVAVGKHFPGHGSVVADSHLETPIDNRSFVDIEMDDLIPFSRMIMNGLAALMPAHVIYPQIDKNPAGFSKRWLQTILRQTLGFQGAIFSDDICMAGAAVAGDALARATQAIEAGCDMVLICNDRATAIQVIDNLKLPPSPVSQARLMRLHGQKALSWNDLQADFRWQQAVQLCTTLSQDVIVMNS